MDKVYINSEDKLTVYEVELVNPKALVVSNGADNTAQQSIRSHLRLLLFEDNATKAIKFGCYMFIENDNEQDFKKIHYKEMQDLDGKVIFYDLNGKMANGWVYSKGKVSLQMTLTTEKNYLQMNQNRRANGGAGREKLMNAGDLECNTARLDTYFWGCIGAGSQKTCSWHFKETKYVTMCRPVSPSGDETTIDYIAPLDYGGYWPESMDCNYVINGSAIYTEDCGCIGGNTGKSNCLIIVENVKDSCLKAQVNLALNAKTTIREMLNSTFGGTVMFEDLELTIRDTTNLSNTTDAEMQRLSGLAFEIRLNQNKLPNTSKEYMLSTIYHEILHAYLESKLTKGVDGRYINIDQHEEMANKYIILMTGALKIAFPNISDSEAWALSWGGLEETPFYTTKLTDAQRLQITGLNDRHKNKSLTNHLGTYCKP
ncbi:hypothetical protein [Pedobacter agri]|uniref:hypothetical protein n=1 Tax=Pedobacter agri TaxID=454586 RepID=UPI00292EEEC5|nr:hypothetical protein [Pedobacter agri]